MTPSARWAQRYGLTPKGPILIEIFPRHDDFAVRNLGLPGMIGALGACFGRVVTLDSPKARPPGTFNWQATLWHELAHVITLQLSKQRVPRWLTEGISEYEEQRARPAWGRQMQVQFAEAMDRGDGGAARRAEPGVQRPGADHAGVLPGVARGGAHPVGPRRGRGSRRLLRAYGEGRDTDTAIRESLGVPHGRAAGDVHRVRREAVRPDPRRAGRARGRRPGGADVAAGAARARGRAPGQLSRPDGARAGAPGRR